MQTWIRGGVESHMILSSFFINFYPSMKLLTDIELIKFSIEQLVVDDSEAEELINIEDLEGVERRVLFFSNSIETVQLVKI